MKIGSVDSKPSSAPVAGERKTAAAPKNQGAEASTHVELSSAATGLGTEAADGSFDSQKVKRIAQAIQDGQYVVHPEAIADKLIANAQELLGKKSS